MLRPKETWLAAHRVDFSVYYLPLKRGEFQTLAAIRTGMPLAQAIETRRDQFSAFLQCASPPTGARVVYQLVWNLGGSVHPTSKTSGRDVDARKFL